MGLGVSESIGESLICVLRVKSVILTRFVDAQPGVSESVIVKLCL